MSIRNIIIAIALVMLFLKYGRDTTPVRYGEGVVAPEMPIQEALPDARPFKQGDYTITPLASFDIEARLLRRESYHLDREADLSPVDFALGWGPMSDERVLDKIEITQSNRWYHWRVAEFPIPRRDIETHSANMHLIPASDTIKTELNRVKPGQRIRLTGALVEVSQNGWRWRSSLTREDTGDHSCEVFRVESVQIY
ncbi:MAG: hypothetical protein H6999_07415 [Hahellaceae bacterium]|nr:hypothetical protein [Hahellaceae bacterium]